MPGRNRKLSNKRGILELEYVSRHSHARNWVWSVAYNDFLPPLLRRAHTIRERIDKSIDSTSHVLHVKDHDIDVPQHCLRRLPCFAVQRIDRKPGLAINTVFSLNHIVLNIPANSMLRSEHRLQIKLRMLM